MKKKNENNRNGTPPLPAADGIREMDKAADAWEAMIAGCDARIDALTLGELSEALVQAADEISEHAHDCRGDDCEVSYRLEAASVYRAAGIIRRLAEAGNNYIILSRDGDRDMSGGYRPVLHPNGEVVIFGSLMDAEGDGGLAKHEICVQLLMPLDHSGMKGGAL